jgi:hypothetical protein
MANEQELKSLRIRRGTIKSAVTRVSNFVRDFGDGNIFQLKTRLVNLREAFKEFDAVQLQIEVLDETALQGNERADFENAYYNIESTILEKIETATVNEAATIANATGFTPSVSSHGTGNSNVRLPILELPTFSGNYRDWLSFRDTFTALIHDSNLYTSIEKFHYLRSCLKDEALKAIESIAVSEANYRVAWETLITRFENKRLIIQEHAYAIINLPPLVKNSYQSLRKLVDDFNINLAALTNLGQPTEHWSGLLVPIISQKMDFFTKREWEAQLGPDPPTVETLKSFLQKKCVTLESLSVAEQQSAKTNNATPKSNNKTSANHFSKDRTLCNASTNKQIQCYMCKEAHGLYQCPQFLNLVIAQRVTQVKEWKVCENCFRKGHEASQCKSRACRYCKEKHNSLLHVENNVQTSVVTYSSFGKAKQNLLATAEILIRDSQGNWQRCRGLLDPGSQSNFISEETVKRLGIGTKPVNWPITTVEGLQGCARQLAQIHFKSLHNPFNAHIDCLVLNKITEELPLSSFEFESRQIPGNINLADPEFNVSRKVDVLLGSSIFWRVLSVGQIKATRNNPHLQETILGWVVGGDMVAGRKPSYGTLCNVSLNSINKQLSKFWDVDEYPTNKRVVIVKKEDIECETHFKNTCSRNAEGRFTVEIPFKLNGPNIGVSKEMAIKRFLSLENKFRKDPALKRDYTEFIKEYIRLNHMELVPPTQMNVNERVFLPHHAVTKETSTTTKLRVVFDASAKTTTGVSLNDAVMVGPKLQNDLFDIIIRFRTHQYVFTADINKMYRQIIVADQHRKYQTILWRESPDIPIREYQLATVTYGLNCAPFLAIRCLQQLAEEEKDKYPAAYPALLNDFFMDDALTGANSIEETNQIREQLTRLLASGGFELRKFAANHDQLLPDLNNADSHLINFDKNGDTKILGLWWNCRDDNLRYEVKSENPQSICTKRKVLSAIVKIYDPLQLIGPVIVKAKLIMQELWKREIGWDEELPEDLKTSWTIILNQLHLLNQIRIPRKVIESYPYKSLEIHGFSDASQVAYGCCVYVRVIDANGKISVKLLCAKSRVAPLKTISIPRLELAAAVLLARLISNIQDIIKIKADTVHYWTDSTIVLAWLTGSPGSFKTFVANRVSEILNLSNIQNWKHVNSADNPADIISRGVYPSELLINKLWFTGPHWLSQNPDGWPSQTAQQITDEVPELRQVVTFTVTGTDDSHPNLWVINQFSTFRKLRRIIALCLRFADLCKKRITKNGYNHPSTAELQNAEEKIILLVQKANFEHEIRDLKAGRQVNSKSKLKLLNPFIDNSGMIRVGGRLSNSQYPHDKKYPIVLPKGHVTRLILENTHRDQLHAGPTATLAAVREKFWPLDGRSEIRKVVHRCIPCFRTKPHDNNPIMGNLPSHRVKASRPFTNCGVDFGGPIFLKIGGIRSKKTTKAYICLFVCFSTKAIHLELVSDLTAANFLNGLKRFIARRGMVANIYSDNATNFVGAQRDLRDVFLADEFGNIVLRHLAEFNINWHFIPARSPHFGGLWEAGIKAVKGHIKRVIGQTSLTYEEMYTLLTGIEACLNSRPLCPLTEDPSDLNVLTPGHFLIGTAMTSPLEHQIVDVPQNRLTRWQHLEQMRQHFWNRWSKEYVGQLQERPKWQKGNSSAAIKEGDLVVLKEATPPLTWKLGRVTAVHPGADDIIRVATVKTDSGTTKRAVRNLCVLPIDD